VLALGILAPALAAAPASAVSYRVNVTCTVPRGQPERQLASNSCLNYIPDGTQTYNATVRDSSGRPVSGVPVSWSDSHPGDAYFRRRQNPCTTGANGTCSAELIDRSPRSGERITVTARAGGAAGYGYLTFR
jgi:Bacterial Ig-like domain (group 1)